jgi:hypothetical protein
LWEDRVENSIYDKFNLEEGTSDKQHMGRYGHGSLPKIEEVKRKEIAVNIG